MASRKVGLVHLSAGAFSLKFLYALRYAHLVHGSISTSGPLLAKVDFIEYYEVVTNSLGTYKKGDCVTAVQKAIQQIDVLMKHMIG